ncbi:hypothetical protein SYJ56_21520 [Algoriphagus sp. D3-2-R+10]|uniref:hypothetical protein n=1 Tax=Algoriphagus aurantiacus TaxID=3103948 RepID=UPI002B3B3D9E|nr:hypothetical protein [Algoriphagus sp. D3-2-R+10]MEB2777908.1 hypothetical protein [Algoriphagus sp. D3-2-R+10]
MRNIFYVLIIILGSCTIEKPTEYEVVTYKDYPYYENGKPKKASGIYYERQKISASNSTWFTENILDSIYRFDGNEIQKFYFSLIDTVVYDYLKNKGLNDGIVIEHNQNKSHLELKEDNDGSTFKRITYSRPKILEDSPYPQDTVEQFNYVDFRNYTIGERQFKIYCFAYIGRCDDCDYCIYFSKEFGELASYSIDWFNLLLIDSISDNEKLQFIKPLTTKLEQDTLFFPYPDSLRRNHDEIRQNSLRMELEF